MYCTCAKKVLNCVVSFVGFSWCSGKSLSLSCCLMMWYLFIVPPGQPSAPVTSDVGAHEITLTWTVSDGGSPLIGHQVDYFFETWQTLPTQFDGNTTQRITGLLGDTVYFFRVRAINIVGPSNDGATSSSVKTLVGGTLKNSYLTTYGRPCMQLHRLPR